MNSVLDKIYKVCNTVRNKNQEPISFKKLVGATRKVFRDYEIDLSIKIIKTKELLVNEFYVEAYYFEEKDFNDDPPIEVIVYHRFEKNQLFQISQTTDFLVQIYDAVVHEFRHQHQFQKRNYENYTSPKTDYVSYLSDPDEVDAYAVSIAIELLRILSKDRAIFYMTRIQTLSKMKRNGLLVSVSLYSYIKHFKNTKLIKKLSKKVYKHLESIDNSLVFK